MTPQAQAKAHSNESANIFITANTLQEAKNLLTEGEALAIKLMNEWTPGTDPQDDKKAETDQDTYIKEYTQTARGQRFLSTCEKAKAFREKKEHISLRLSEIEYIHALASKNLWNGLTTLYDVAFKKGYNTARSETKKA